MPGWRPSRRTRQPHVAHRGALPRERTRAPPHGGCRKPPPVDVGDVRRQGVLDNREQRFHLSQSSSTPEPGGLPPLDLQVEQSWVASAMAQLQAAPHLRDRPPWHVCGGGELMQGRGGGLAICATDAMNSPEQPAGIVITLRNTHLLTGTISDHGRMGTRCRRKQLQHPRLRQAPAIVPLARKQPQLVQCVRDLVGCIHASDASGGLHPSDLLCHAGCGQLALHLGPPVLDGPHELGCGRLEQVWRHLWAGPQSGMSGHRTGHVL
eukprot:CAMPEP_0177378404 /NCGR_PEP_ID=MMETSP0368-20130122/46320_1 /TAXON_ID=447022 ORGANISM="Scrippsiella hangoei-like, Strain SHHI-4" /NCGR_SAMPLE_ID=MMETSP0368 /ASSEMBLY_ACC=CAM_ASM_000363 /LENGTH=264 /DNA_ID=CAMNT_0018842359 /DNA_START=972 /DNA_END=1767 /DNA_ORIENTATION=-